jgi:hypothetical protein
LTTFNQSKLVFIRGVLLFFVLGLIVVLVALTTWQGYDAIGDVGPFTVYKIDVVTCEDYTFEENVIVCENAYLLRSGFSTYLLHEALESELISLDDLKDIIEIKDQN